MRINLSFLNAGGHVSANIPGQLTTIMNFRVPQGQFFALDTRRPQVVRLAAQETTTGRAITAAERTANALNAAALTDHPVRPPARYIPVWPSQDGYTFKAFLRRRVGANVGPWTPATINAVDWTTRILTIALPANIVDHAGATVALAAADTIDIRISYINASGRFIWRRETPDNAQTVNARTSWDVSTFILGSRDQLDASGRFVFDSVVIWVPQQSLWRWYLHSPVVWDFDPVLSATQIELNAVMMEMARAEEMWRNQMAVLGIESEFANLYSLFVAQLAGLEPEAFPLMGGERDAN